ncbi:E3 ubiquitin-protein ligase RFWD3-like [Stylophora pistillata]|uniref:RING-type E3 ubiquitin transferase n=1 Tax=Stylophora pistillata TaxID=50429 RepID=A0A2B4SY56_STYPI|nr:E3 ubiquitin-protein ligase RFWD3-like [Stylophora pistillata]PFX34109.1 E3 ubiquitin-protein ligase RFWD3 [Stylophora pistillata]
MASNPDNDDVEVVEIVSYDRNDRENEDIVELEDESDREEQEMEVDSGGDEHESELVQQPSEENNVLDESEVQSSIQNVTPAVGRSVQVVGVSAVNSPDDFQQKSSKTGTKNISVKAKNSRSPIKSPEKDEDSQNCPICFEPWSNSGSHRLSSLTCGHLFGRSCIERWLKAKGGNDKCPQCNAPARKKDIRNIYTKAIKAIDTTERDRALADLQKEKEARKKAEEREARALLQYQLAKAECERIVEQLKRQEQLVVSLQRERSGSYPQCGSESEGSSTAVRTLGQSTSGQSSLSRKSYVLQTSFQVSQNGARVISFDQHHAVLVVSKPSPNQLFPGFGIVKVSSLDSKHCEFVRIHQKAVRDVAFNNRGDGLLLTASMDKTVRVTSMLSNTVVQTYNTPAPAWSCAWNEDDTNYIYCGLQNGTCLIFDIRNTDTYLKSIQNTTRGSCPVIALAHVSPDPHSALRPGGILVCKLEGASFWEKTPGADFVPHCLALPEGSCTSLSFEPSTRHCLFSLRPSKKFPQTRHLVCQLQGKGVGVSMARAQAEGVGSMEAGGDDASLCTCQAVNQCVGGPTQKLLSKSRLFTCPNDYNTLMVAAGDESFSSTLIWNGSNGNQLQKLPNQGKEILDVLPFAANGNDYLATIDEQKLSVYKWMDE